MVVLTPVNSALTHKNSAERVGRSDPATTAMAEGWQSNKYSKEAAVVLSAKTGLND